MGDADNFTLGGYAGQGIEGEGDCAANAYLGGVNLVQIGGFNAQTAGVTQHENWSACGYKLAALVKDIADRSGKWGGYSSLV